MNVLIIDNFDSFTFNLYQYIGEILRAERAPFDVIVKRNNALSLADIDTIAPERIIISPGPGAPDDPAYFGICSDVIQTWGKHTPLLGVCLGMQGIAHVFGGKVGRARVPMHGKTSPLWHDGAGVYHGLPQGVDIMRYHSLAVEATSLPDCLTVTSLVHDTHDPTNAHDFVSVVQNMGENSEIMGIRHREYPIQGVQFHPESFATEGAKVMLKNFLFGH